MNINIKQLEAQLSAADILGIVSIRNSRTNHSTLFYFIQQIPDKFRNHVIYDTLALQFTI